uniref:Secreted protein n=1 Tax=Parascaris univalens TaxID=6257 RepID=A0A915ADH4_PARUN
MTGAPIFYKITVVRVTTVISLERHSLAARRTNADVAEAHWDICDLRVIPQLHSTPPHAPTATCRLVFNEHRCAYWRTVVMAACAHRVARALCAARVQRGHSNGGTSSADERSRHVKVVGTRRFLWCDAARLV